MNEQALVLGSRLAAAVQEPIKAAAFSTTSASVGIAVGAAASIDPDVLVGQADAASYRASDSAAA